MKKMNKKGFTLAELLIVIAIMAILIAIAIPVFSTQLERARHAVDDQMDRSAKSIAESHFLLEHAASNTSSSAAINMKFSVDGEKNLVLAYCSAGTDADAKNSKCGVSSNSTVTDEVKATCTCDNVVAGEHACLNATLDVTVSSDGKVSSTWKKPTP